MSSPPDERRLVYVLTTAEREQKIGMSITPAFRATQLDSDKIWTPVFEIERPNGDAYAVERLAHSKLAGHALGNERFAVTIEQAIAAVCEAAADIDDGRVSPRWRGRDGKKVVQFWLDNADHRELLIMSRRMKTTIQALGEEWFGRWAQENAIKRAGGREP